MAPFGKFGSYSRLGVSRHYGGDFIIYTLFSLEGQAVFLTALISQSASCASCAAAAWSWGPPINTPSVSTNEGHSGCSVSTHTHTHAPSIILPRPSICFENLRQAIKDELWGQYTTERTRVCGNLCLEEPVCVFGPDPRRDLFKTPKKLLWWLVVIVFF